MDNHPYFTQSGPYLFMNITANESRRPPKKTPSDTPIDTTMSIPNGKSLVLKSWSPVCAEPPGKAGVFTLYHISCDGPDMTSFTHPHSYEESHARI